MTTEIKLTTPVGRLIRGSLYTAQTVDGVGNPLVYKKGDKAGQPRPDFNFGLAIPKGTETHWSQTEWGKQIYSVGFAGFPNGQAQSPTFAWKIIDGDSAIPNSKGNRPCDRVGYAGHWILNFSNSQAPKLYNYNGTESLVGDSPINLGDYVQVCCMVADNKSPQQPGIYLNHLMVALAGYGERISQGADPKAAGFGEGTTLPPGASKTPIGGFNPYVAPVAAVPAYQAPQQYAAPIVSNYNVNAASVAQPHNMHSAPIVPPQPYPQILQPPVAPPVAAAPQIVMTPKANGGTYEQFIASGWTHEQLMQHEYIV